MTLHNTACIYASLGDLKGRNTKEDQDVALALLRRAIRSWKQEGGVPSEIDLMKGEVAFKTLRQRKEFQQLLNDDQPAADRLGMTR
jgi:hypothetical protein